MVLIYGDKSPVIYLYYLNRKGVVINKLNQKSINRYKKSEFNYIVGQFNEQEIELMEDLEIKLIKKIDSFYIYSRI